MEFVLAFIVMIACFHLRRWARVRSKSALDGLIFEDVSHGSEHVLSALLKIVLGLGVFECDVPVQLSFFLHVILAEGTFVL